MEFTGPLDVDNVVSDAAPLMMPPTVKVGELPVAPKVMVPLAFMATLPLPKLIGLVPTTLKLPFQFMTLLFTKLTPPRYWLWRVTCEAVTPVAMISGPMPTAPSEFRAR